MAYSKKIPNNQEMNQILKDREDDLKERGDDHPVYDYSGKIVTLKAALLWYDENCKYVKPKSTETLDCIIS